MINGVLSVGNFTNVEPSKIIELLENDNKALPADRKIFQTITMAINTNNKENLTDSKIKNRINIRLNLIKIALTNILLYRVIENVIYFYRDKKQNNAISEEELKREARAEGDDLYNILKKLHDRESGLFKYVSVSQHIRQIADQLTDAIATINDIAPPPIFNFANKAMSSDAKVKLLEEIRKIIMHQLPPNPRNHQDHQAHQAAGNKTKSKKSARKSNGTRKIH
jgi:hypothetical protein